MGGRAMLVREHYGVKILRVSGGLFTESYSINETYFGLKRHVRSLKEDKRNYEIEVSKNGKIVVNFVNY